jgi:hypothetical protein
MRYSAGYQLMLKGLKAIYYVGRCFIKEQTHVVAFGA